MAIRRGAFVLKGKITSSNRLLITLSNSVPVTLSACRHAQPADGETLGRRMSAFGAPCAGQRGRLLRNAHQMAENDLSIGGMMGRDSVSREAMSFGRSPE